MAGVSKNLIRLSRIQKLIGNLMLQSKRQKPYCYLECIADLTELTAFRKPYCKQTGLRVTTNDFFFCAMARAVQAFPLMAGQLDPTGDFVRISKHIGVGFAVSAPQGLVVPVIKEVESKSLAQIAEASGHLLNRARANKLTPDDFHGDTIVLSGLGMYGISSFLAIAPPGATGILSIGNVSDTIVFTNGDMMVRKMMSVSLAADRRIVDEFYAARFLRHVITQLEDPLSLTR
ncbi:MAG: 2-oxo acid dehydrogenase subunit E2 [Phycisphaerae bacterium]|nr:2-oxo acid dehydrogenase subunit E2 [Phycisphaerae bacterium]